MAPPTIVVIDDDPTFLALMEDLLQEDGYRVEALIGDGSTHERICAEQPAVVILDLWLGQPDAGWTLLSMLELDPATRDIPVIIASGDSKMLEARADELAAKGIRTLTKPFGLDELLTAVRAMVGTRNSAPVRDG
jgi:CheY-like chemotaxis protein